MDVRISPVYGSILDQNSMSSSRDAFLSIPGKFKGQSTTLNIDKDTLSKHSMLIGGMR